jgi:hypothetical protein
MGEIVSYKKDQLGPRCHMKLASGERVLIHSEVSTNAHATDPVWLTISTLKMGGLIPGAEVFRLDQRSAEGKAKIADLPAMKTEGAKPAAIDAFIELFKGLKSLDEAKARLAALGSGS